MNLLNSRRVQFTKRSKFKKAARTFSLEPLEARQLLTTFEVTSLLDGAPVQDGVVTLREAIMASNSNTRVGDAEAGGLSDTIVLKRGLHDASRPAGEQRTIKLDPTQRPLHITGELRLEGLGSRYLTIDAAQSGRVLHVTSTADVVISRMTITGGQTSGQGGGILNEGSLVVSTDTVVSNNKSDAEGGGIGNLADLVINQDAKITGNTVLAMRRQWI